MKSNRPSAVKTLGLGMALILFLGTDVLAQLPNFADLAQKVGPSVVNVNSESITKQQRPMSPFPHGTPFDEFFNQFFGNQLRRPRKEQSLGSGFVISSDGYIATNNHVVENAQKIRVTLQGYDNPLPAEVIGTDPETDLALIKINAKKPLTALSFGDSNAARVGDWVLAVGDPFGLDHTITAGIISAKGRVIGEGPYDDFLQTDASINPGNSGGPLINMNGEVVGINTAIVASGQGIGFAIPSNIAKTILAQLKEHKTIKRGLIGVEVQDIDENTAKALGLKSSKGALVASVVPGEPADKAGVQSGDVILSVNGQAIDDSRQLTRTVGAMAPGSKVTLGVWRKGETKQVELTLGVRNPKKLGRSGQEEGGGGDEGGPAEGSALGMQFRTLSPDEAKALRVPRDAGVLIANVDDGSPAAEAGIQPGDVLAQVAQQPVHTPAEAKSLLEKEGKDKGVVLVLINRQGQSLFRSIPVG